MTERRRGVLIVLSGAFGFASVTAGLLAPDSGAGAGVAVLAASAVALLLLVASRERWMLVVGAVAALGAACASVWGQVHPGTAYGAASMIMMPLFILNNRAVQADQSWHGRPMAVASNRRCLVAGASAVGGIIGCVLPARLLGFSFPYMMLAGALGAVMGIAVGVAVARQVDGAP